jgi:uncharacterized membrane protein SpoIIM required for sporulation
VAGLTVVGVLIGWQLVERFPLVIPLMNPQDIGANLESILSYLPVFNVGSVFAVFWQNVRVLLFSMVLGLFTFGVIGVFPLLATMVVAGYLLGVLNSSSVAVLPLAVGLLLPHGIFEIPAAILATAAVLDAGAILATPTPGRAIGEVWLVALADWAKVMLGVVVPLLLVASCIEVWVTPQIALLIFGN